MDFSEIFPGVAIGQFSPNSQMLALCNGSRVVIKDVNTLNNLPFLHSQFSDGLITQLEFSPDSQLLALCYAKKGYVELRKAPMPDLNDETLKSRTAWVAKIDDTATGIEAIKWAPDSCQLLVFSEFQQQKIKVTIYNLSSKQACQIKGPKFPGDKGMSFSSDGKFLALAERRDAKDYVGIYSTKEWKLLNYQPVETTDLVGLAWSTNDSCIAIWDAEYNVSPIVTNICDQYRMLIHCPSQGCLMKFQPYDCALGIKASAFSQSGEVLAIGSYDEKIRLINLISLRLIVELDHKLAANINKDLVIYKEEEYKDSHISSKFTTKYINIDVASAKIQTLKVSPTQPNPPQGISQLAWSFDDVYIASKNDNTPNVLWIWDAQMLELKYVLQQISPIKNFQWASNSQTLVLCTGQNKIYFWSPASTSACDLPYEGRNYNVQRVEWSADQKCMMLFEKNEIVVAYPQTDLLIGNGDLNDGDDPEIN